MVDAMDARAVHDGVGTVVDGVGGHGSVRSHDVEPLREEQVDLLDVLFQ